MRTANATIALHGRTACKLEPVTASPSVSGVAPTPFQHELAELIVTTLNLEDVEPDGIAPDDGLFDGELALDSVDALELALAVSQTYGVQLKADDQSTREAFSTLASLAAFIESHRGDDAV